MARIIKTDVYNIQNNDFVTGTIANRPSSDLEANVDDILAYINNKTLDSVIEPVWGNITGTLSNQTDLQNALDGKSNTGHTHTLSDITDSGTAAGRDIGTSSGDVMEQTSSGLGGFGYGVADGKLVGDLGNPVASQFFGTSSGTANLPAGAGNTNVGISVFRTPDLHANLVMGVFSLSGRAWIQGWNTGSLSNETEIYTTGNLNPLEDSDLAANGGTIPETNRTNVFFGTQDIENNTTATLRLRSLATNGEEWRFESRADTGELRVVLTGTAVAAAIDNVAALKYGNPTGDFLGPRTANFEELYENGNRVEIKANLGSAAYLNEMDVVYGEGSGAATDVSGAGDGVRKSGFYRDNNHGDMKLFLHSAHAQNISYGFQVFTDSYSSSANLGYRILENGAWTATELLASRSWVNSQGFATGDNFNSSGTYANLRAQATTKGDVGLGNVPNTDATNADNISSGTLSSNRLPAIPSISAIDLANKESSDYDVDGRLYWDLSAGLYIKSSNAGHANPALCWTSANFTAGSGISVSYDGEDEPTLSLSGDSFNASGTYSGLRAQSTTKGDVGLGNVSNLSSTSSATANTVMERNSSGDTWCRLFRSSYSSTNSNIAGIYTTRTIGGDYMRPSTPGQLLNTLVNEGAATESWVNSQNYLVEADLSRSNWDTAYDFRLTNLSINGSTGAITATRGGTSNLSANFTNTNFRARSFRTQNSNYVDRITRGETSITERNISNGQTITEDVTMDGILAGLPAIHSSPVMLANGGSAVLSYERINDTTVRVHILNVTGSGTKTNAQDLMVVAIGTSSSAAV